MIAWRFVALLGALALLAGCSQDGPEIVPVTGKVTRNGQPVPKLFLSFQPDNGRSSWGISDDEGNFELEYDSTHKGARVGNHSVTLLHRPASIDEEMKMVKGKAKLHPEMQRILAKYGPSGTDKLQVTIAADQEPLDLKLD